VGHPLGDGQVVDRRQVPDLVHLLEHIANARIDPQVRGGDVALHQLNPLERVWMSGLNLADSTVCRSHVLGLDQTDGPDSLATCQQAG